jgi:surface antigen
MSGRYPKGPLCLILALLALAACAGPPPARAPGATDLTRATNPVERTAPARSAASDGGAGWSGAPLPAAQIVAARSPLQCVPYARQVSGIGLRGDAWTWWRRAAGHYERGPVPRVGAVLVFSKTQRLRGGHLAVVTRIVNSREILVEQANWLNGGQIHLNTPVRDVSPRNDWSLVRVWYTPGGSYGVRRYPTAGFIYQERVAAAGP